MWRCFFVFFRFAFFVCFDFPADDMISTLCWLVKVGHCLEDEWDVAQGVAFGGMQRSISAEVQAALFDEVEKEFRQCNRSTPLRSADWRGGAARGGVQLVRDDRGSATVKKATKALRESSQSVESSLPVAGEYWSELSDLGGSQIAGSVQRWLMRFVDALSIDDIELLAES